MKYKIGFEFEEIDGEVVFQKVSEIPPIEDCPKIMTQKELIVCRALIEGLLTAIHNIDQDII